MASKNNVELKGVAVKFVEKYGASLSEILHVKYGVVATINGLAFEKDWNILQPKKAPVVPEKRLEATLSNGVTVSVWKADLTNLKVDAVVNAANTSLSHHGGLADALSKAGGPKIQKESDDFIRLHGKLKTGDAVTLGSGNLPCKAIIHAVGPQLSNPADYKSSEHHLEMAIHNILNRVWEGSYQTVAIPAISSGLFNYPLKECANTIVETVKKYYKNISKPAHLPKEIFLANHDDPTVDEMERACKKLLNCKPPKSSYSQAAAAKPKGAIHSVQLANVHLTLEKAYLQEQQTDVIVNTASPDRNLNSGAISKSLLKKAGTQMQREINSVINQGLIIQTDAYHLNCKKVFHTFCPSAESKCAEQILIDSVKDCLWMAITEYKSISFPAIGTGALGFSKGRVATLMSDVVADFATKCPNKIDVHFVIYPDDRDTFKEFEEQMRNLQKKAASIHFPPDKGGVDEGMASRSYRTPHVSLDGPCSESIEEAEKWLTDLLKFRTRVQIENNFIQHLASQDVSELSLLQKDGLTFEEFLSGGHAIMDIESRSPMDVAIAMLKVETMLCRVQKDFVEDEEGEMKDMTDAEVVFKRKPISTSDKEFQGLSSDFSDHKLFIVKIEKVENRTLERLFNLKQKQLGCFTSKEMLQRIPAQFCEMVCRIGFHVEIAPPEVPEYGEGIYFAGTVKKANEIWKRKTDAYLYFVVADVLTGKSTRGKPGLILPPNDKQMYDSVDGGSDISVIFSGYQALPKYILTCHRT